MIFVDMCMEYAIEHLYVHIPRISIINFIKMLSTHLPYNPNLETTEFSTLELPSLSIRILDKINPCYYFISHLYLDHNLLLTLNGIQQFQNLEIFSFNFNCISSFGELGKVKNKFMVRELGFIGNPMEGDSRARVEGLWEMGFTGLERVNPIGETRFGWKFRTGHREKLSKAHTDHDNQGKTQRYAPIFDKNQLSKSRKMTLKSQTNSQPYYKYSLNTEVRTSNQRKLNKNPNISTTLNKSSGAIFTRSKRIVNHKQNQEEEDEQVNIQPFETKNQYSSPQKQQMYDNETPSQSLQQYSPIRPSRQRKNLNKSLFTNNNNNTGHFDEQQLSLQAANNQSMKTQNQKEFKDEKYRDFAVQFLEEQKILIVEAFRIRHLKQKVMRIFKRVKEGRTEEQKNLKKKAWAVIKMFRILEQRTKV